MTKLGQKLIAAVKEVLSSHKCTKFVWETPNGDFVEYFAGDVSLQTLVEANLYEATYYKLKSRTVLRARLHP